MDDSISLQVPLRASFFLEHEASIDQLLAFSEWDSPSSDEDIRSAVQLMVPLGCTCEFVRVGGGGDGAYLLPDQLQGIEACFSPGVSTLTNFEQELADDYGIPSFMCDASVQAGQLRLKKGFHFFESKWLGSFSGGLTQTIDSWVLESVAEDSGNLLLQMDIEGSEYNSLLACSESVLSRFRVAVIEFHQLDALASSRFLNMKFLPVMNKLLRHFDCVHAHPNNCCGTADLGGWDVPRVIELTFLRKAENKGRKRSWKPHPLDIVNVPSLPEIILGAPWV